jgi:hypothetical protein
MLNEINATANDKNMSEKIQYSKMTWHTDKLTSEIQGYDECKNFFLK